MTIETLIKKSLLPLMFLAFWGWMSLTIMKVSGITDFLWFLFLWGFPFGIHKMCFILIPKEMDIGGTVGMVALSFIIGGLTGIVMAPAYFVRAVYVLIRYIFRK